MSKLLENLRQWFRNIFDGDWLDPSKVLVPAYRSGHYNGSEQGSERSIRRAKIIDFPLSTQAVTLVVELTPESEQEIGVSVEIYPGNKDRHLPLGLQVIALEHTGETILDEQAESGADSIQLEFGIQLTEHFSVKLILGNDSYIENI